MHGLKSIAFLLHGREVFAHFQHSLNRKKGAQARWLVHRDFGVAVAEAQIQFFKRVQAHIGARGAVTSGVGRRANELGIGSRFLHLVQNADLGCDQKLLLFGVRLHVFEKRERGADKVGFVQNGLFAFGVRDNGRVGVRAHQAGQAAGIELFMDDAKAGPQHHFLAGLLFYPFAQMPIRPEYNRRILGQLLDNRHGIARCDDNIAHRFNGGRRVNVVDDRVTGKLFEPLAIQIGGAAVGETSIRRPNRAAKRVYRGSKSWRFRP